MSEITIVVADIGAEYRALIAAERDLAALETKTDEKREDVARRRLRLGRALAEARKQWPARGPKAKGWGEFLARLGIDQPTAWRYMQLAGYSEVSCTDDDEHEISVPTYAEAGIDKRPRLTVNPPPPDPETQPDPGPRFDPAYGTSAPVSSVSGADDYNSDEWYTPIDVVESARRVLGAIDLDPATCEHAQRRIGAKTFYTKDDDGLVKEWRGRVWLNPPYSQPAARLFAEKLVAEYQAGRVTAAVMVQNASTDTGWFHAVARVSTVCLTRGRINFDREDGRGSQNRYGQVFFYLGSDPDCFASVFTQYGLVLRVL